REVPAGVDEITDGGQRRLEQRILVEQVLVRVGRQAQLREEGDSGVLVGRAARERQRPLDVAPGVRDADGRNADRRANEPVLVNRVEDPALLLRHIAASY